MQVHYSNHISSSENSSSSHETQKKGADARKQVDQDLDKTRKYKEKMLKVISGLDSMRVTNHDRDGLGSGLEEETKDGGKNMTAK